MTEDPARKAMDAALRLLKFRGRSEKEMSQRLREKKFEESVIAAVVARLVELKLLDDEALARGWVDSARRSGWGERRIKQVLWKRGVPRPLADQVTTEAPEEGAATEESRAREALTRRLKRMKTDGLDKSALYRRLAGYLSRQGFSPDVVHAVLESL
jgi:regulatory protein